MKAIISKERESLINRDKRIKSMYKELMAIKGSKKMAVIDFIALEIGKTRSTVYRVINIKY